MDKWDITSGNLPKYVLVKKPRPRIFEYDGEIWHHLGNRLGPGEVLARKGSWVKSSVYDYKNALDSEMHAARKDGQSWLCDKSQTTYPKILGKKMSLKMGCKDHLECFIEKL